jgi:glycosyltransferase involved in cell wall biosynthesis
MYRSETISVIFPTYNEKESIREAIDEFFATGIVDEVIVVNNNAAAGTSEEVAKTKAREILESRQGYGYALQRGLQEATGDILIMAEPDGTFCGHDVEKLLAYAVDVDVVFGTRTSRTFIWQGANMGLFLKWGNYAVAKMTELLFNTTMLSDMGCTMRLLRRRVYERVRTDFRIGGSHFGPHLMLLIVAHGIPFIEVPVNYRQRIGESSVTGSFFKAFELGVIMIGLVLKARFESLFVRNSVYYKRGAKCEGSEDYFRTRMPFDTRRRGVWREIVRHLSRYFRPDQTVLEIGAGYCDCINAVPARRRIALDVWKEFPSHAAAGVETIIASANDIPEEIDGRVDVVISSNLFEHLPDDVLQQTLAGVRKALKPGGKLIVLQPNYRLNPEHYFDDPTHIQTFSDDSLCALLNGNGFQVERVEPRFLPLTLRSRLPVSSWLVRLYLASPWRPLAGQMLVVATR